jgi:FixJ family two-component response regulator
MKGAPLQPHHVATEMNNIIRTVTEHANEMNRRWGFNRLPHLVSAAAHRRQTHNLAL